MEEFEQLSTTRKGSEEKKRHTRGMGQGDTSSGNGMHDCLLVNACVRIGRWEMKTIPGHG